MMLKRVQKHLKCNFIAARVIAVSLPVLVHVTLAFVQPQHGGASSLASSSHLRRQLLQIKLIPFGEKFMTSAVAFNIVSTTTIICFWRRLLSEERMERILLRPSLCSIMLDKSVASFMLQSGLRMRNGSPF